MNIKKTLWSFGDSFSAPYGEKPYKACFEYINYKGYEPKMFSHIIAESLGMNCIINAKGGLDNYSIMENVCNNTDNVTDGDIILIGWSNINRFRMVRKNGEWLPILPFLRLNETDDFNMDMLDIFAVNRLNFEDKYTNEVNSWIKLINKAFQKCDVIHWSAHSTLKANAIIIKDITTISKETKNLIKDGHHGETGQKELANIFLNKILKKETNFL